jgi:CheY-like chemotaxis protein
MKRPKILVVDDDQPILTLMQNLLREYKFDTILADSGHAALDQVRSERPDLILLDMKMPNMSGEEAIRAIRAEPGLDQVPILIVSGEPVTRKEIEAVGADGAVTKPFDLDDLIHQIRSHVAP